MTLSIHFSAPDGDWPTYGPHLEAALRAAGIDAAVSPRTAGPASVDYIVYAPNEALSDFTPFTRCKAVLSLWAGVERIVTNPTLTQPLCRMVDPGMTESMVEYVTGHVLRHHLGMDAHILGQDGIWRHEAKPPLARQRPVAMLGLGALGRAAAEALRDLRFPVMGWSRTPKNIPGIACHSGADGLAAVLRQAEIAVLLMPLTAGTRSILNADRLALMPKGAVIINPGRGPLIDDDALIAALDAGQIGHATLDVFRAEPLPPGHPFWSHPGVTVTPHIAADTKAVTATRVIAENIRRAEAGEPLLHLVDRMRGY
jgi:glyoxylate/hydroxypyruvate reductase A